jgi:PiT family inorganic phosphate transporter
MGLETSTLFLLILALCVGFYMAWNIGANDVANAIGTSVGSGALTLRRAVILAAIFEFIGAYFLGNDVAETMGRGIIRPSFFIDEPIRLALGMISALLATGLWLQMASYFGWPVSTTHSIVGAIAGVGFATHGMQSLNETLLIKIAISWVISPVVGGIFSYIIFSLLRRAIFFKARPLTAIKRWAPLIISSFSALMSWLLIFNLVATYWLKAFWAEMSLLTLLLSVLIYVIAKSLVPYFINEPEEEIRASEQAELATSKIEGAIESLKTIQQHTELRMRDQVSGRIQELEGMLHQIPFSSCALKNNQIKQVEAFFGNFQCVSACLMALGHGANDVSNAVGPLAVAVSILYHGQLKAAESIPGWLLFLGGGGIVVGLATWGWRVIETVGSKITQLTPSRGFSAEVGCATTVLFCSQLGMPVSTTHVLVGSIMGVGIARGIGALNLSTLRNIFISWLVTLPMGAVLSMAATWLLQKAFL